VLILIYDCLSFVIICINMGKIYLIYDEYVHGLCNCWNNSLFIAAKLFLHHDATIFFFANICSLIFNCGKELLKMSYKNFDTVSFDHDFYIYIYKFQIMVQPDYNINYPILPLF
jgi:hypothetical protein